MKGEYESGTVVEALEWIVLEAAWEEKNRFHVDVW